MCADSFWTVYTNPNGPLSYALYINQTRKNHKGQSLANKRHVTVDLLLCQKALDNIRSVNGCIIMIQNLDCFSHFCYFFVFHSHYFWRMVTYYTWVIVSLHGTRSCNKILQQLINKITISFIFHLLGPVLFWHTGFLRCQPTRLKWFSLILYLHI